MTNVEMVTLKIRVGLNGVANSKELALALINAAANLDPWGKYGNWGS